MYTITLTERILVPHQTIIHENNGGRTLQPNEFPSHYVFVLETNVRLAQSRTGEPGKRTEAGGGRHAECGVVAEISRRHACEGGFSEYH